MEELTINPLDIKQILVGIALDANEEGILKFLRFFAGKVHPRSIHFLHIIPDYHSPEVSAASMKEEWKSGLQLRADLKGILEETAREGIPEEVCHHLTTEILEGNPLEVLLDSVASQGAEMVFIGKHADRTHHGIEPGRLARRVPVDTCVVPDTSSGQINHILVPIDFSENSIRALHKAIALKESMSQPCELTVMHIYELPNFSLYRTSRNPDQWERMIEQSKLEALDLFLNTHTGPHRDAVRSAVVKKDLPGLPQYILHEAESRDANLVVMGAKGHSKVELVLMGSVTEKVVRETESIPVWVVK